MIGRDGARYDFEQMVGTSVVVYDDAGEVDEVIFTSGRPPKDARKRLRALDHDEWARQIDLLEIGVDIYLAERDL